MEDYGWLIFIIAVWALVYAFVIEIRRRRESERILNLFEGQLDNLRQQITELKAALAAGAKAAQPIPELGMCAKCGDKLQPGFKFCMRCGTPVEVSKPTVKVEESRPAVSQTPVPAVSQPPAPPRPAAASASHAAPSPQVPLTAPKSAQPAAPAVPPKPPMSAPSPAASSRTTAPPSLATAPPPHAPAASAGAAASTTKNAAPRPIPAPTFGVQPAPKQPRRSVEEVLSIRWLPIIGIAVIVIGLGFLVGQKWGVFSHGLRALLLYASSLGLLALGIFLERKNRYRILGRALIGGGWAGTALITYAIANLQPLLLIQSEAADLFLLLAVVAAMVGHTLKYKSQLVTGAGFLLGFLAIGMNPVPPYNLMAGALLIIGLTVIVLRYKWYQLEVAGILAAYGNHIIWLYRVYEQQGGRAIFPHHSTSVALAIGYWVIFRISYLARKISSQQQEAISTWTALLSPVLFLTVMWYQGFHPEWAWWFLITLGAVEFALGELPLSRRRLAPFQILSSLGFVLMLTGVFRRFSGNSLDLIWLAGAEAFLLAGIFTRERLFRVFGVIVSFAVAAHAATVLLYPLEQRLVLQQPHRDGQLCLVLAVIAAAFYANAHAARRFWPKLFEGQIEDAALTVLSFIASVFAASAIYAYMPDAGVAVALGLLVLLLSVAGKSLAIVEMTSQAHWIAIVAFVQVIVSDSALTTTWWKVPQRVLAFSAVAALLYLSSRFVRLSDTAGKSAFAAAYAWSATGLLALLIWYQFQQPGWAVAVLWVALGLALCLVAQYLQRADLKLQAFALVAAALLRSLAFNLNLGWTATNTSPDLGRISTDANSVLSHISFRLVSVSLTALGIYLLTRWAPTKQFRPLYTMMGTLLLAVLAYQEAAQPWIAVAWITMAVALCVAARWWQDRALLWQTHAMAALAVGWSLYLFYFAPQYRGTRTQWVSVGITAALFYALTWITNIKSVIGDDRLCQGYAWAGSLLASWLIWAQLDPGMVSLAWCVFGVVLYELPDLLGSVKIECRRAAPSWHGQSYVALFSGFVHIFIANFNAPRAIGLFNIFKDPHVLTVLPLPFLYFYIYWRIRSGMGSDEDKARTMAKVVAA